ncbi:MAG: IS4 family transposase, partial [Nitrosopumilaceae archaeon]
MTLGWSDGSSFLPTDFALMASSDPENLINGINKKIHKNTNGYKRRREALKKATENVVDMVARTLQFGINADYVLMDSWFCFPVLIEALKNLRRSLHVICMLKDLPSIQYQYHGRSLRRGELYAAVPKRRGQAIVKASVIVKIASRLRVRIIFVKHRHKQDWLAILSTNLNSDDEEIIRIYGKRWDIEVFFKVVKNYLQ